MGDAQVGKTTLMVKYVENKFDEEYIMTLGETKWSERRRRESAHHYVQYLLAVKKLRSNFCKL